jgi:hypothetical protein
MLREREEMRRKLGMEVEVKAAPGADAQVGQRLLLAPGLMVVVESGM